MKAVDYSLKPIGIIRSQLERLADAPLQGDEGSYDAWLDLIPEVALGLLGIHVGDKLIILTWLHQAQRDILQVQPRDKQDAPMTGVFATRSSHRPNPIGLHEVTVLEVGETQLRIAPIEAIDGTPIIDLKPVLGRVEER